MRLTTGGVRLAWRHWSVTGNVLKRAAGKPPAGNCLPHGGAANAAGCAQSPALTGLFSMYRWIRANSSAFLIT